MIFKNFPIFISFIAFAFFSCSNRTIKQEEPISEPAFNRQLEESKEEKKVETSITEPMTKAFEKGRFTDTRDGQSYPTIEINGQIWMAKNLNFKISESYCYNNGDCQKYGRLYALKQAKSVCPEGWHLPGDEEWSSMMKTTFGKDNHCADCYTSLITGGESGFEAFLGGIRFNDGVFYGMGVYGKFWSATDNNNKPRAACYYFSKPAEVMGKDYASKTTALSCRCVKD